MDDITNVPAHVSIIMDGNGRWAKLRGKERVFGHAKGVESVRACVRAAAKAGVRHLSLFAFSEENWARPDAEVGTLMTLMMKAMTDEIPTLLRNGVSFRVLGNLSRLSSELLDAIREAEEKTRFPNGKAPVLNLVIFLSYSGKWDILQAARSLAEERTGPMSIPTEPTSEDFERRLVTHGVPDPDLIIRTSGEKRISNFLLWQAAYSELLFVDTLWPDFGEEDFLSALKEYAGRERRYGKVK